ncbi:MAG: phosphosulfolactate synthase [Candidatus Marinimicrobia bacterium]|nr:phosphosulfolactate synthase [Candidatus Neomarinimicrobiota bacterium]
MNQKSNAEVNTITYSHPDIVPNRINVKPRPYGITMMLDRCLGLKATEDLIHMAGEYLDQIKVSFGTAALLSEAFLRDKIDLVVDNQIDIYPGGTLMEIAFQQSNDAQYIKWVRNCGFTAIEISDGIYKVNRQKRDDAIKRSRDYGLKVMTEVGKKDPEIEIPISQLCDDINADLESGTDKVIIEGRESGRDIGIYDKNGIVQEDKVEAILEGVGHRKNDIMWEAPRPHQQASLIIRCGSNVNLGNVLPRDVLGLEALRRGLRYDTLPHFAPQLKVENG